MLLCLVRIQAFLGTKHPLKDREAIQALSRLARSAKGAVTFDIRPGSPYASKVAIFYSQAAAFGAFLSARSCKGRQAIGGLLSTYDIRLGLDQWLRTRGGRLCLPTSVPDFERSFSQFIDQESCGRP